MSIVTLVSGGLDSTLVAHLTKESGIAQFPLFVDYGQRSKTRELDACRKNLKRLRLPEPKIASLAGFGRLAKSGLTDKKLHVLQDAFTPGRNLLFLLAAASYAYTVQADAVAIGLLNESTSLFPDQTSDFLTKSEITLSAALGRPLRVLAPLASFSKADVVKLAKAKRVGKTYSCHAGGARPCGVCIACREFDFEEND